MNGNIAAAIITSVTTIACLLYTTRRQTRRIETLTRDQTEAITTHVTESTGGGAP